MAATVVALLLPLIAGATAERTALVATAGLFVRPLAATELSSAECADGAAIVGAAAGGGCGMSSSLRPVLGHSSSILRPVFEPVTAVCIDGIVMVLLVLMLTTDVVVAVTTVVASMSLLRRSLWCAGKFLFPIFIPSYVCGHESIDIVDPWMRCGCTSDDFCCLSGDETFVLEDGGIFAVDDIDLANPLCTELLEIGELLFELLIGPFETCNEKEEKWKKLISIRIPERDSNVFPLYINRPTEHCSKSPTSIKS